MKTEKETTIRTTLGEISLRLASARGRIIEDSFKLPETFAGESIREIALQTAAALQKMETVCINAAAGIAEFDPDRIDDKGDFAP